MIKGILSILWKAVFIVLAVSLVLSHMSPSFSDAARAHISLPVRNFLAALTNGIGFPTFELIALFLILSIPFLVWRFILGRGRLSALLLVLQLFVGGYAVTEGIDLSAEPIEYAASPTDEEYLEALRLCAESLDGLDEVRDADEDYSRVGETVHRYALDTLGVSTSFIPRAKISVLSSLLTRLGTLAYYPPLTAEAIINADAPGFMRISSYSHELMHFFGIMRENEATFFSTVALISSEDSELEYAGYLTAYISIGSKVYGWKSEEYRKIEANLPTRVKKDLAERSDFLRKASSSSSDSQSAACLEELVGDSSYGDASRLIAAYLLGQTL